MTSESVELRDFRAVYRGHHGLVWHALHRFGVESAAIEDAVQDVFVVAYRRRADVRGTSTKAWLYGIARRVASNYRRSDRRRVQRARSVHAVERRTRGDAREAIQALDSYLAELDEEDREIFLLSELEGMTGPEIAEVRGRNVNTVYTRIGKLRRDLHDRLGDLERAKAARPRATAQRWAAIMPLLRMPTGFALGKGVIALAFGAAAASGVLVVADRVLPPEPAVVASVVPIVEQLPEAAPARREAAAAPVARAQATTPEPPPPPPPEKVVREPPPAPAPPPADDLALQNELLRRATTALASGRADEALQITTDHAQRFPGSPLFDLRTALRIEALCTLGKHAQARGEARLFLAEHAQSPVKRRISRSCAAAPRKPAEADTPGT